jgi:hypothetical protein
VRKPALGLMVFNYSIAFIYSIIAVLGTVGAIRFIVLDSINYSLFANIVYG